MAVGLSDARAGVFSGVGTSLWWLGAVLVRVRVRVPKQVQASASSEEPKSTALLGWRAPDMYEVMRGEAEI